MTDKLPDITVDRKKFDAILAKMIANPPTSKAAIGKKINLQTRKRPLTHALLQK